MAHDFARKMVDGRGKFGGALFFLTGGSLLLAAVFSLWIYGEGERSSLTAMAAAFFMGAPLVFHTIRELFGKSSEMNELVAIGVMATFVSGRFFTSASISFVMILTASLEGYSTGGARESLRALLELSPPSALVDRGGVWISVDADDLAVGDRIKIRPGGRVPADGVVLAGESSVDQSTITGESLPVEKKRKDRLFAGTVNLTGTVVCEVDSVGSETTLGKVRRLISDAEISRTPVMRIVDRYAGWYVPFVMIFAGAVLFATGDLERAVSTVIVACPCSIILSGSTAVVALLGAAARFGIVIKDVASLELAERLSAVVFDKTGTVTTGRLEVTEISPVDGVNGEDLLSLACSVERDSMHPVARSICEKAAAAGIAVLQAENVRETHGMGVDGTVGGRTVVVGRRSWIRSMGVDLPDGESPHPRCSVLYVAVDRSLAGEIYMEDRIKDGVTAALESIRKRGVDGIVLLSGDRESVVGSVSRAVGISSWESGMLPQQKMAYVSAMKAQGDVVAVVGDGINDGPALSAGDLSISMGAAGSDLAISSSSIALMNDDIGKIPLVMDLSRKFLSIMRQNLGFSSVAIILSIFLGALGVVHPVTAAILHGGTSLAVIFNSARLVRFEGANEFVD